MSKYFTVKIKPPYDKLPVRELEKFIEEALGCWAGQLEPPGGSSPESAGNPLWGLSHEHIKVTRRSGP